MEPIYLFKILLLLNLLALSGLCLYLPLKARMEISVIFLLLSFVPLIVFQLGSLLFISSPFSGQGVTLLLTGVALLPLTLTPMSQTLARKPQSRISNGWFAYYACQLLILAIFFLELMKGHVIEWVTGILDQPLILIERNRRLFFLNILISCGITLLCFESTLRNGSKPQQEKIKYILIGYLGIIFYFFYLASQIIFSSYMSRDLLLSGSALMFVGILLILYSLIKYPIFEVEIYISRRIVFGCLTFTALLLYLFISGWVIGLLQLAKSQRYPIFLPAILFSLMACLLSYYLSPTFKKRIEAFLTRNFFRNKYDYRDLWMKFLEKTEGSLNPGDILPKIAEFIADSMYVRQVVIWLPFAAPDTFGIAYSHDGLPPSSNGDLSVQISPRLSGSPLPDILRIAENGGGLEPTRFPFSELRKFKALNLSHILPVRKHGDILGWLGVGKAIDGRSLSLEDEQLLVSISSQLAHLILTHRLSEELVDARRWEWFNRLSSFVIHDLKNLATQQSLALQNAKSLCGNPDFIRDAFATFGRTTDKMIHLIGNLSVQKESPALNKERVNLVELLKSTLKDLNVSQRKGVRLITEIPSETIPLTISGDQNLLRKVFTNILLNALQSLPNGEGTIQVSVSHSNGSLITTFTDTGCGIQPEILSNLFRPFQTTKKGGMGIGLCHTRSIVETHGGRIRIQSQVNRGTKVEIELPAQ